jgi:hypothetical protein
MARGWESKHIESQQHDAESRGVGRRNLTPQEVAFETRRTELLLDRTRIMEEMQRTSSARLRGQLQSALTFLEAELDKLEKASTQKPII